jgi:hypothetical protein
MLLFPYRVIVGIIHAVGHPVFIGFILTNQSLWYTIIVHISNYHEAAKTKNYEKAHKKIRRAEKLSLIVVIAASTLQLFIYGAEHILFFSFGCNYDTTMAPLDDEDSLI